MLRRECWLYEAASQIEAFNTHVRDVWVRSESFYVCFSIRVFLSTHQRFPSSRRAPYLVMWSFLLLHLKQTIPITSLKTSWIHYSSSCLVLNVTRHISDILTANSEIELIVLLMLLVSHTVRTSCQTSDGSLSECQSGQRHKTPNYRLDTCVKLHGYKASTIHLTHQAVQD